MSLAPMSIHVRLLVWAVVPCLLVACNKPGGDRLKSKTDERVPVAVTKVVQVPLDRTLNADGTLSPAEEAVVSAEVEGRVERIQADVGDVVSIGKVLAEIETEAYQTQAALAAANLAKAQANATNASQNLKQVQDLRRNGVDSESDLDLAMAQAGAANAEVKASEANLALANLDVRRSRVVAPLTGVISDRLCNVGEYVRVGAPLFRVFNDKELELMVAIPESEAGQVQNGQVMRFGVPTFPEQTFDGTVHRISPFINRTNRSLSAAVLVPNVDRKLKPGMNAQGNLILASNALTAAVPLAAVQNLAGTTKVFVITNDVATARSVRVGPVVKGRQEILSGLQVGETVVTSGPSQLRDGAKVRLQETTNPVDRVEEH
jgi:membrane fusion protein (multidrug efflux system)